MRKEKAKKGGHGKWEMENGNGDRVMLRGRWVCLVVLIDDICSHSVVSKLDALGVGSPLDDWTRHPWMRFYYGTSGI